MCDPECVSTSRSSHVIIVPIFYYMAIFEIHFSIIENSGGGEGFMSSEFQRTLAVGERQTHSRTSFSSQKSPVVNRHVRNTQSIYLTRNYPGCSKQQPITLSLRTLAEASTTTRTLGSSTPLWLGAGCCQRQLIVVH